MSYSKDLSTYPRDFFMIAERFVRVQTQLEIPFSEWRKAIAWRARFNGFKSIVAKTPEGQVPMVPEAREALLGLQVRLGKMGKAEGKDVPMTLIIEHVDYTEEALALRTMLANEASAGGDQVESVVTSVMKEEKVDPYQLRQAPMQVEGDAMEALLEQQYGALTNSDALHCSLCDPKKQCWTGIGECEHKVD